MKKRTFTLVAIFIALFSFNSSAYNGNADLILSTWNKSIFFIVVDGQTYDSHLSTYHIRLNSGSHHLEVYTYRGSGNMSRCLFNSNIHLKKGVTNAMITSHGSFHKTSFTPPHNNHYGNGYNGSNHYGNTYGNGSNSNYGHNGYYNNGYGGTNYGNNGYSGGNNSHNYSYGMSHDEYANLKRMIRNTSFDSSRLKIAQSAVIGGISSKQVLGICSLFSFESSRLDFAKFAYNYTIDKDRYYIVNDAFTFNSSIDELSAYVYGF